MFTLSRSGRTVFSSVALLGLVIGAAGTSRADLILYATSQTSNQILRVDLTTNQVTPILNASAPVDSLIFDSHGDLIYSENTNDQVRIYNPNTHVDSLLASFSSGSSPVDLALAPGGQSVYVSLYGASEIDKIDLSTGKLALLGTYGGNPEGLAFDSQGHLFANLGVRDSGADKYVAQIDPITGAVLATSAHYSSLDGLTYDRYTGQLYAASLDSSDIVKFNPNNLSSSSILPSSGVGNPDGIVSDGKGNLIIASRQNYDIYTYNLKTSTLTQNTYVNGLDDIAPLSGQGALPEPSSMTMLVGVAAMGGLGAWLRRRRTGW